MRMIVIMSFMPSNVILHLLTLESAWVYRKEGIPPPTDPAQTCLVTFAALIPQQRSLSSLTVFFTLIRI